ncbi:protein boule-like isoform X19 [Amblyomma americanum]
MDGAVNSVQIPKAIRTGSKDMARQSTNSTEGSHSPSPAALNAPRYGTMVPKRIFVGGISASTTEAELHELFSHYGVVTNAKIIVDRAGVSKGYGFVTFDSEEDAQRAQASANNIMLRDRRLNIAPAIKKQPFSRVYDPAQSVPTGTVLYQNGVPYMYHNGTAFFHPDALAYQYSPPATTQAPTPAVSAANSTAATASGYPLMYQPPLYYPQQTFQYPNVWNAPNGQWRWAAPAASHPTAAHPTYLYPAAMVGPNHNGLMSSEGQEYQDPAIVETGSEVGAALMPSTPARKQDDGGGTPTPSSLLASVSSSASLGSFCGERDLSDGQPQYSEAAKRGGPGATWRDCLFGTPPTPASTRSQCP